MKEKKRGRRKKKQQQKDRNTKQNYKIQMYTLKKKKIKLMRDSLVKLL